MTGLGILMHKALTGAGYDVLGEADSGWSPGPPFED